jgi:hypothetical protein
MGICFLQQQMTLHSLAITKTVQGQIFTMDFCRNKASVFLKTGSEIQLHFAESKPGQIDANGRPGDGAFDEPDYIEKLWYYLGIPSWPDAIYEKYPNAYRS